MFHRKMTPLALGQHIGREHFALSITTRWYSKSIADQAQFPKIVFVPGLCRADERHKTPDLLVPPICRVCRPILIICPLYCAHRLDTDRFIENDIFGWSEPFVWPTK